MCISYWWNERRVCEPLPADCGLDGAYNHHQFRDERLDCVTAQGCPKRDGRCGSWLEVPGEGDGYQCRFFVVSLRFPKLSVRWCDNAGLSGERVHFRLTVTVIWTLSVYEGFTNSALSNIDIEENNAINTFSLYLLLLHLLFVLGLASFWPRLRPLSFWSTDSIPGRRLGLGAGTRNHP